MHLILLMQKCPLLTINTITKIYHSHVFAAWLHTPPEEAFEIEPPEEYPKLLTLVYIVEPMYLPPQSPYDFHLKAGLSQSRSSIWSSVKPAKSSLISSCALRLLSAFIQTNSPIEIIRVIEDVARLSPFPI
jgi:hypothetical protein